MAQGKAWEKDRIIAEVLKPVFRLGYSVTKACQVVGLPHSTVDEWIQKDDILRLKIITWQNEPNLLARKQWLKSIKEGLDKSKNDIYTPSKDWLERREKDEFSTRQENTGKDGKDLIPVPIMGGKADVSEN